MKLFDGLEIDLELFFENEYSLTLADFKSQTSFSVLSEDKELLESIELELCSLNSIFEVGMRFNELATKNNLQMVL
jgi:hypothetical protein